MALSVECCGENQVILMCKFVQIYIVTSKSIIVKRLKWVLMIQNIYKGACPLMGRHMPYGYCTSKVKKYYYCYEVAMAIQKTSINSCWGSNVWSDPKSYNRYYIYFCVPWILGVDSDDPHAGTTNDYFCCFC